jgi:hypothetical protein
MKRIELKVIRLKNTNHYRIFLLLFFVATSFFAIGQSRSTPDFLKEECTIGVASGKVTSDGRPMVWKSRDNSSAPNNEVIYNTSFKYKFLSVSTVGSSYAWMGLNEHGLAIVNTLATDLQKGSSGPSNGALMRDVLGNCKTVAAFRHYLDSTNRTGRTTRGDFGVIDSTGEAAVFEISGDSYWEYNAKDAPHGYVIRTNFSMAGGGSSGIERYDRSKALIGSFYAGDSLNVKSILRYQMRDFSDFDSQPVSVPYKNTWGPGIPYGYINTSKSICRNSTVSAVVVQGVLPTEPAGLSVFWTILGQPATAVAVPYWPVAKTPPEADGETTAPLCDVSRQIRAQLFDFSGGEEYINSFKLLDGKGAGLWTCSFPFEDSVLQVTARFMDSMRMKKELPVELLRQKENELAALALQHLKHCRQSLLMGLGNSQPSPEFSVYPNPASGFVNIRYQSTTSETIDVTLYSPEGKKLFRLVRKPLSGKQVVHEDISRLKPGVYFLVMRTEIRMKTVKLIVKRGAK